MKDWTEFNAMKDAGWKTKTLQEYNKWKQNVKEWYANQELTDWDKEQIKKQLEKINDNKQEYFNKPQFKGQPKQSYIFRPEEGETFIKLANALTEFLLIKIKSHEN